MNNQAAQTMPGLHGLSDAADYLARNPSDEYAQRRFRERMEQVRAALSQTAGVPEPLPMDTAPRDGTMVRLLVNFTDHATEDTAGPAWTIGAYPSDDESGGWQFAGWCWTHDHFTEGEGTPIGWLPMLAAAPAASGGEDDRSGWCRSDGCVHKKFGEPTWKEGDNPFQSSPHPDALPDGTLSKSTAKRVEALGASGVDISHVTIDFPQVGTAGPFKVIDGRMTLPDVTMNDLIHHARMGYVPASNPPAGASVSERARELLAKAYRDGGYPRAAGTLEAGVIDSLDACALSALEQALTQQRGGDAWIFHFKDDDGAVFVRLCHSRSDIERAIINDWWNGDDAVADDGERMAPHIVNDLVRTGVFHAEDGSCYAQKVTTPQPSADAVREYDRDLIARMLETPAVFEEAIRREQASLLREAENLEVDARSVVREVPDGMVLVPRDLRTANDVWEAGIKARNGNGTVADIWEAMLSAASGEKGADDRCRHEKGSPGYDYWRCHDCGAFKTDSGWGVASNRYFNSRADAEFYRKHGRLPEHSGEKGVG